MNEEAGVPHLAEARCFIFDMDGTVLLGSQLIDGAKEFINYLASKDIGHIFLTNNSANSRKDYVEKLGKLGLTITEDQVFTSGEATARFLLKQNSGARVFLAGTPSLEREFRDFGFQLTDEHPDFVVLGFDTTLTYQKLYKLCDLIRSGVPYIATHPDINCPTETGFMPDIGSIMALIETSTGRRADVVIGKPNLPIVEALLEKTGVSLEELVMVGDRLYTDINMGQSGITTVLVLSGETKLEDIPLALHQPDYVVKDLGELHKIYLEL